MNVSQFDITDEFIIMHKKGKTRVGGSRSDASTVELHCQPATGSSIIMVIFRWPPPLQKE